MSQILTLIKFSNLRLTFINNNLKKYKMIILDCLIKDLMKVCQNLKN